MKWSRVISAVPVASVLGLTTYDLLQKRHALLRNYPVFGHMRYFLETIGPELRQYIVSGNKDERPFTRNQRRWVYAPSKLKNNYFGFGSDKDTEYTQGYPISKHRIFADTSLPNDPPAAAEYAIPCAKCLADNATGREHFDRHRW